MKSIVINSLLFIVLFFVFIPGHAQETKRRRNYLVTSQYAGSIGYLSIGVGLTNKKKTIHYELMYGNLPKVYGGPTDKVTLKFSVYPISVKLTDRITWKIVNPGLFLSKNIGEKFPLVPSRSKYPKGYYWWAPGLRFHLSASSAVTFKLSKKNDRKVMLYFETNTNERYLTTFFSESNATELSFWGLWQFGVGGKFMF